MKLEYTNSDGEKVTIDECNMTTDKVGRFWLWCDVTKTNIAYKQRTERDCLLAAIDSLLFTIQLRSERIEKLERIAALAKQFAEQIIDQSGGQ